MSLTPAERIYCLAMMRMPHVRRLLEAQLTVIDGDGTVHGADGHAAMRALARTELGQKLHALVQGHAQKIKNYLPDTGKLLELEGLGALQWVYRLHASRGTAPATWWAEVSAPGGPYEGVTKPRWDILIAYGAVLGTEVQQAMQLAAAVDHVRAWVRGKGVQAMRDRT